MHSTISPSNNQSKKITSLISCLKKCDRILVHTFADLNRLKDQGLIENVSLFPHGILNFSTKKNKTNLFNKFFRFNNKIRIASYGFCLPNKGFRELILAINLLKKQNTNIHLDIYSAVYNKDYLYEYDNLVLLVNDLNLSSSISLNNQYMTDTETLETLSKYDAIVFPYQESNESSSASVRHGLATHRPVLVTPSSIFEDILDLVYTFDGFSPKEIAQGIINWHNACRQNSVEMSKLSASSEKSIKARSFSNLSQRLYSIIRGLQINKDL